MSPTWRCFPPESTSVLRVGAGPAEEGVVLDAGVDADRGPHAVVVRVELHARCPHDVEHGELRCVVDEGDAALLRIHRLGDLVRLRHGCARAPPAPLAAARSRPPPPGGRRSGHRCRTWRTSAHDPTAAGVPRSRCRSLGGVTITIDPMTVTIGAEIGGVDLADDLSDETIEEIRQALLDWKVIFFRDQHRLDRASHVAFGRRFGDLEIHPVTPKDQDQPRGVRDPRRRRLPRAGSSGTPTSPGARSRHSARSCGR